MIQFSLPYDSDVVLDVYSVVGTRVAILFEGQANAGQVYRIDFEKKELADGSYIYRLNTKKGMRYGTLLTN